MVTSALAGRGHFPSPFSPPASWLSFFARDAVAVRWSAFLQVRDSSWPLHRDRREQACFSGRACRRAVPSPSSAAWAPRSSWRSRRSPNGRSPGQRSSSRRQRSVRCRSRLRLWWSRACHAARPDDRRRSGLGRARPAPPGLDDGVRLVLATLAELSWLTLVLPPAAYLLPVVRFPAFAWLITAGAFLPSSRRVSPLARATWLLDRRCGWPPPWRTRHDASLPRMLSVEESDGAERRRRWRARGSRWVVYGSTP